METATHVAKAFFAKAIIAGTFIRVGEHSVGFVELFKFFLSAIFLVHIGMVLTREFTERGFDLVIARVPTHAQDFVVIAVAHKYCSTAGRVAQMLVETYQDQQFQSDFLLLVSTPAHDLLSKSCGAPVYGLESTPSLTRPTITIPSLHLPPHPVLQAPDSCRVHLHHWLRCQRRLVPDKPQHRSFG